MTFGSVARWGLSLAVFSTAIAACSVRSGDRDTGPGGGHDAPGGGSPLRIEPVDLVAPITAGAPVTVDYRAFLTEGGSEREVTGEVAWSSTVPSLGAFTGAQFVSATDRGGTTTIRAQMGSAVAVTTLTLT